MKKDYEDHRMTHLTPHELGALADLSNDELKGLIDTQCDYIEDGIAKLTAQRDGLRKALFALAAKGVHLAACFMVAKPDADEVFEALKSMLQYIEECEYIVEGVGLSDA